MEVLQPNGNLYPNQNRFGIGPDFQHIVESTITTHSANDISELDQIHYEYDNEEQINIDQVFDRIIIQGVPGVPDLEQLVQNMEDVTWDVLKRFLNYILINLHSLPDFNNFSRAVSYGLNLPSESNARAGFGNNYLTLDEFHAVLRELVNLDANQRLDMSCAISNAELVYNTNRQEALDFLNMLSAYFPHNLTIQVFVENEPINVNRVFGLGLIVNEQNQVIVEPIGNATVYISSQNNDRVVILFPASNYCYVYEGNWDNGELNFQGRMSYQNGDVYEGKLENIAANLDGNRYYFRPHGLGTMTLNDGTIYTGTWYEGVWYSPDYPNPLQNIFSTPYGKRLYENRSKLKNLRDRIYKVIQDLHPYFQEKAIKELKEIRKELDGIANYDVVCFEPDSIFTDPMSTTNPKILREKIDGLLSKLGVNN